MDSGAAPVADYAPDSLIRAADSCSTAGWAFVLRQKAYSHPCASHPLFQFLKTETLTCAQVAALLHNYDAHATALRRLLLKAATIMPEEAVTYVLENVRNEYGNGNPDHRHQLQLLDLAYQAGVTPAELEACRLEPGVRDYISRVNSLYFPQSDYEENQLHAAATAGGAITATELLALR